jgi:acetyltransferase-like isoleucine patch superfamily enzyme
MSREWLERIKIDERYLIRQKLFGEDKSALRKYKELVIGEQSLWKLLKYELLTTMIGPIPGLLGLGLRRVLYPYLLKNIGKGVVFGKSVVIRHPDNIRLGNRVVIDDYCVIDGRGAGKGGIVIADDVIINRGVMVQSKVGAIHIGGETNVGAGSTIISMGGVYIGDLVSIGGGCFISGGSFTVGRGEEEGREQEKYTTGPVRIGNKARFGMRVIVLDGVQVGQGCIVGAGSVVTHDLPEYCVAAGSPATVKRPREARAAKESSR